MMRGLGYLREMFNARHAPAEWHQCWLWTGAMMPNGYGQVNVKTDDGGNKHWMAHRLSHFLATGQLPEQVHHECGVKNCVNPVHLTGMTLVQHQAIHHLRNGCEKGHSYDDPSNLYIAPDGRRQCRPCKRDRMREYARR